jgi:hypothetical protein
MRLRGFDKALRDYRRSRYAALLELITVVETPRCAGASIGDAIYDDAALPGQFVDNLLASPPACVTLFTTDKANLPELLGEPLLEAIKDLLSAMLMIIQHADDKVRLVQSASGGVPGSRRSN